MVLPINDFEGNSNGENIVWKKFREFLPDDFVSFHNYNLGLKEVDVILLVPEYGAIIIEIKGISAKNILDVPDTTIIRMKNQPAIPSPLKQASKYRFILVNELKNQGIDNVYVTNAVCYPLITKEEYIAKNLNKISDESFTITKEDLETKDSLLSKIVDIFEKTYDVINLPELDRYGFNNELLNKVGNVISPNFRNGQTIPKVEIVEETKFERKHYSELFCVKNSDQFDDEKINSMLNDWMSGTKIYFYTSSAILINKIKNELNSIIESKNLSDRKAFKNSENLPFLFNMDLCENISNDFVIYDGENYSQFDKDLEELHENSSFNKGQYEIEHAPLDNIIVKAGAGTGKTYSMISRINYLVWKKEYESYDLKRAISMITFTNESADAMKEKLTDNFLNYYLLTKDSSYLDYIECVEDMNISTIHSLAKKILQTYASKIGLGKDFSIVTGEYKRDQILHEHLNKFINEHEDFPDNTDISMFFLGQRLHNFLDKLDNKNVDIVLDYKNLKFGTDKNEYFNEIIKVLRDAQSEMNEYCKTNNSICLGELIRKLKVLYHNLDKSNITSQEKIDFLFVDEFQDTDDVQIELITLFKELFGFKLFVVGDIKQCIYRFRGAEVKAFDTLTKMLNESVITLSLNKNYRTDKFLMDELNTIFSRWNDNNDIVYGKTDRLEATKTLCNKLHFDNLKCYKNKFADTLINTLKTRQTYLKEDEKIAILVRYNWQIANIKKICDDNGISIETEIGGELFRIDPTIDLFKLVSALKYNNIPKYLFNLYTTSYVLEDLPKKDLWNKTEKETIDYFYANLPKSLKKWQSYTERLRTEPVLKVLRDIIDDAKPWNIFAKKIEAKEDEIERCESYYIRNLDQLFEKLILDSNSDYLTINKISDYLEIMILTRREEKARESYDIDRSKSQILCTTVHKSKGLEFDTVILPYCDFDISCSTPKGDVDLIYSDNKVGYRIRGMKYDSIFENDLYDDFKKGEILDRKREETRILYVALTRAIKKLVTISIIEPTKRRQNDCWAKMIKEAQ